MPTLRLPYWAWYTLFVFGCTIVFSAWHASAWGGVNGWQTLLAFFLAVNIITCVQEICLGLRISTIERWTHDPAAWSTRPKGSMWLTPVSPRELASATFWARLWYEYAFYDPSYADRRSFGFFVDIGNGWWTLVPSVVFLFGMTLDWMSPVALGLLGALLFYQKLYNTSLYFVSYLFNRRYELQPIAWVIPIVGGTNGVWLVFPAIGLWVCTRMILDGSDALIR